MKKILMLVFFFFCFFINVSAVSIADFTFIHEPSGKYYSFYDNPKNLFFILNEKDLTNTIESGYSEKFSYINCRFEILNRKIENISEYTKELLKNNYSVKTPDEIHILSRIEVFMDFKTIRGIGIGDSIYKIINLYPEAIFFKRNSKDSIWLYEDCYNQNLVLLNGNEIPENLGYAVIRGSFYQYNRTNEVDFPMDYELVFVLDDKKNVKSIIMDYRINGV